MWLCCLMGAVALFVASGVPGLFAGRRATWSQTLAAAMMVGGSLLGISAAMAALCAGAVASAILRGPLPELSLHFHLDPLAAFFLLPICVVGAAGSVYGLGYWSQQSHPRTGRKLRFLYGLFIASMAMVVLAADAIAFLFAWEVMALSAFFLISTEEGKKDVRDAAWLYLVATHIGTLFLFALFAMLRAACGTFELRPLEPGQAGLGLRTAIFLVAVAGFGLKAGMMPLHFWLPGAHANAPSHISAVLSGVLLKVGIYGLLRTLTLLPTPPVSWGGVVLLLGTVSAVVGVLFALGQHDLKRLLAYHSVENIGIILMGLGLAMIGQSRGSPALIVLGLAGCLLHVWNHALFKSLLFLAAGSVIHSARTRDIDLMGGLARPLPKTALLFFIGALAICGLPPLNGFVSELFIYLGLFHSVGISSASALAAAALALVGALALACFVKAFGSVFLGLPRSPRIAFMHESPATMVGPMIVLASCCAAIGLFPLLVIRPLGAVIGQWHPELAHGPVLGELVPLAALTPMALLLAGFLVVVYIWGRSRQVATSQRGVGTWDCGFAQPTSRMQYTASSFAAGLVDLFGGVLRPASHEPVISGAFPAASEYHSRVGDVVLERVLWRWWAWFQSRVGGLRVLQQGSVQAYVLYILIILSLLMLMAMPLQATLRSLLGGGTP